MLKKWWSTTSVSLIMQQTHQYVSSEFHEKIRGVYLLG